MMIRFDLIFPFMQYLMYFKYFNISFLKGLVYSDIDLAAKLFRVNYLDKFKTLQNINSS